MFRRDPSKNPTTLVQKILTYGLIFFMLYIYFGESKREREIAKLPFEKTLKVTNVLSGETKELNQNLSKIILSIKAGDIQKLKEKPVGKDDDLITVFEIEVAPARVKTDKKENNTEEKSAKKSNLDAKPVSN